MVTYDEGDSIETDAEEHHQGEHYRHLGYSLLYHSDYFAVSESLTTISFYEILHHAAVVSDERYTWYNLSGVVWG